MLLPALEFQTSRKAQIEKVAYLTVEPPPGCLALAVTVTFFDCLSVGTCCFKKK